MMWHRNSKVMMNLLIGQCIAIKTGATPIERNKKLTLEEIISQQLHPLRLLKIYQEEYMNQLLFSYASLQFILTANTEYLPTPFM